MIFPVTAQMIVKNEERFVWFAIQAVLPFIKKFLITDTGSTDNTLKIIQDIKSKKIVLTTDKKDSLVKIRQRQLKQTQTPWFLLVDGDEVWPRPQLLKLLQLTKVLSKSKIAVVNETRNCVGDVWHYLPENTGEYCFFREKGHFNIRLMRRLPYTIINEYPLEEYCFKGKSVNRLDNNLEKTKAWYLHLTHLQRTSIRGKNLGRRKKIKARGLEILKKELPEVFFKKKPKLVKDPLKKRSIFYKLQMWLILPIKIFRRRLCS